MGACSSKPKTTEFEGNMNFYRQQEMEIGKNSEDDRKSACDAGSQSNDLKIAEFKETVNFCPQEAMAGKINLGDGQKNIDPEQTISSHRCPLQNLMPAMKNKHGGMGNIVLELEEERLAGSGLENKKRETYARAKEVCDAKHHYVAEGVPEIDRNDAKVQNRKKSFLQEFYEEPALAQKEDVLGSVRNSVLCDGEVVKELIQKVAFGDSESGKFQVVENINEEKELPSIEGRKPGMDVEEGSGRAIQGSVFMASKVLNVDFELKIHSAGNLMNCGTKNAAACSTGRTANFTMLMHNDKSRDLILEKQGEPEGLVYEGQRHDVEEALKEESDAPTQDTGWTNLMVTPSNGLLAIKESDLSHIKPASLLSFPDANALSNGSLKVAGIKVEEFACVDSSPSILKSTGGKEADKQLNEVHMYMASSMCGELSCHIPNSTEVHLKCSASTDKNLGVHETDDKPFNAIFNPKVEDGSMAWNFGNEASSMIRSKDGTQVALKKGSMETFFVAETKPNIRETLDTQTSSISKVHKEVICSIQEENYASKQECDLFSCPDDTKIFEVFDMTKEQVTDCKRHSDAASQPFKTFQEPRHVYGKDMVSDIDEMLEKLASEFERQETLSSSLP